MILLRPVNRTYAISQRFGENLPLYPQTHGHNGLDYACPDDTPVMAAADGIITRAELDTATAADPHLGYGYHVRIQHANDAQTIYGHLRPGGILVKTGQLVLMGEVVGRSGNTGRSTGPHLHLELRTGLASATAIDPEPFLVDEIPPENGLFQVTITPEGDHLNVRTGPSSKRGILKVLRTGDRVTIFGLAGSDAWLRTTDGYIKFDPSWEKIEAE